MRCGSEIVPLIIIILCIVSRTGKTHPSLECHSLLSWSSYSSLCSSSVQLHEINTLPSRRPRNRPAEILLLLRRDKSPFHTLSPPVIRFNYNNLDNERHIHDSSAPAYNTSRGGRPLTRTHSKQAKVQSANETVVQHPESFLTPNNQHPPLLLCYCSVLCTRRESIESSLLALLYC